jgi:lipid-A-disaccharide synthase-like uncharacterized protein
LTKGKIAGEAREALCLWGYRASFWKVSLLHLFLLLIEWHENKDILMVASIKGCGIFIL